MLPSLEQKEPGLPYHGGEDLSGLLVLEDHGGADGDQELPQLGEGGLSRHIKSCRKKYSCNQIVSPPSVNFY